MTATATALVAATSKQVRSSREVSWFQAMGASAQVIVLAPEQRRAEQLMELAVTTVEQLEQCWSRFRPNSELCQLNAAGGGVLSATMSVLVSAMQWAYDASSGLVDATLHDAVLANGYSVTFAALADARPSAVPRPSPGMDEVVLDGELLVLPRGVRLDPGAIGKGLAADLVADLLMSQGATGCLVELSGDLRCRGTDGAGAPWSIATAHPSVGSLAAPNLPRWEGEGGVATSSTQVRRWASTHHVLDPRTGAPTRSEVLSATVSATTGLLAEVGATIGLVGGLASLEDFLERTDGHACLTMKDGSTVIW